MDKSIRFSYFYFIKIRILPGNDHQNGAPYYDIVRIIGIILVTDFLATMIFGRGYASFNYRLFGNTEVRLVDIEYTALRVAFRFACAVNGRFFLSAYACCLDFEISSFSSRDFEKFSRRPFGIAR